MRITILIAFMSFVAGCSLFIPLTGTGPENIRTLERTSVLVIGVFGQGSGVVVHAEANHSFVLTAAHMYSPSGSFHVQTFSGESIPDCYFVDASETVDLGIMYVPKRLPVMKIATSMPLRGSTIYIDGNKLGGGFWPSDGIYGGIIGREGDHPQAGKFARASTPVHPGNSGGAVVYDCKLIGIVSRILVWRGTKQLLPTTHMFVPVTQIRPYLDSVRDKMVMDEIPARLTTPKKKVFPIWKLIH